MDILDIMMAKKISGGGGGGEGGTTDHRDLSHRNDSNQHSMEAITGLNDALAGKMSADTPIPSALEDLEDDATHRTVTDIEKDTWNAKGSYSKPSGGIPASDMAAAVQTSLGKADSAIQTDDLENYATQEYVNQQIAAAIADVDDLLGDGVIN